MNHIPFLYVNLIAMCGYAIIFVSFIAAKKTPEIKSFIALLTSFILWTGGSILMRLQAAPGLAFWYYVSIMSLFCIAVLTYIFVCLFTKTKGTFLRNIWIAGTVVILILTALGVFLKPPVPVETEAGTVFTYSMGWQIAIPYAFFACIVVSIVKVIRESVRRTGHRAPGMNSMILGCIIIAAGNLLQIIPGNIFPWDTLSGIITAGFLVSALYRKRMFRLTLLVSRGVIVFASVMFCLVVAINYVEPVNLWIQKAFNVSSEFATSVVIVLAVCLIVLCYVLLKKLIDALFTREEQQNKLLQNFSDEVTKTLDSRSIMALMAETIQREISTENVYVCMRDGAEYASRYVSSPLASSTFSFRLDTPLAAFAKAGEICYTMKEFESSTAYLAMWDSEKKILKQMDIACVLALIEEDEVVGLVLLSKKERNNSFTLGEISFLSTLGSIAAIAMKNAGLYEQMAREARTDQLTGVFNYRHFTDVIQEEFNRENQECLALLFVNIDDFKLYNQLYGASEGDDVLRHVAEILQTDAGERGIVFRYGGSMFAVILPDYDSRMAKNFADGIRRQLGEINGSGSRVNYKKLTASCGICVAPFGASTWGELVDNTDLATYKAKKSGKDTVVIFKSNDEMTRGLYKKVEKILDFRKDSILGDSAQAIAALTAAIDAKDHYTAQHSMNVARYAAILAAAQGMNDDQVRMVYAAGLLHDIGKISVPETILQKDGKLTDDEFSEIKGHVNGSIEMIKHLPSMDYLIPAAIGHHERWDGRGYPMGTKGEDIPVSARCLCIADAFDAMTTDRPYRKALSIDYAADQIEKGAGTQFDPQLAELFVELVRTEEIKLRKIS